MPRSSSSCCKKCDIYDGNNNKTKSEVNKIVKIKSGGTQKSDINLPANEEAWRCGGRCSHTLSATIVLKFISNFVLL